jgi:UDP-N-acetylmuramate--alanine ligase
VKRACDQLLPDQINDLLAAAPGALVHLVGAGGCGMGGLGHLLLDLGFRVSGSDLLSNEETRQLAARGARIWRGHAPEHLRSGRPRLVAHSSAVPATDVELRAAEDMRLPVVRRAALLGALLHRQRGLCVAGMHGKTTTTALLAFALDRLGARPSWAVGAQVPQLPRPAVFSVSTQGAPAPFFVIETDESDGTLGLFRPEHVILLNVDAEHLDYFPGIESVCAEFGGFARRAPGLKVYCADDGHLTRLLAGQPGAVSFGYHAQADYRVGAGAAGGAAEHGRGRAEQRFAIWRGGKKLGEFSTRLLGEKNVSNAAAVVAMLHQLGYPPGEIARALAPFEGAARRQQLLYAGRGLSIYDDYGHHPSEIQATLRAFRGLGPKRLLVAFQPHRYTRTKFLLDEFASAFGEADQLWLTDIYAASEPAIPGVDSTVLAQAIRARGQSVEYVPDVREVGSAVFEAARPGDLLLFLGAGDITQTAHALAKQCLAGQAGPVPSPGGASGGGSGQAQESRAVAGSARLFHADDASATASGLGESAAQPTAVVLAGTGLAVSPGPSSVEPTPAMQEGRAAT